jgi:hypothetical protein
VRFRIIWMGSDGPPEQQPSQEIDSLSQSVSVPFQYEKHATGLVRRQLATNGRQRLIPLTNFRAQVVADRIVDDDYETHRRLAIEAEISGQKVLVEVAAREFSRMDWVVNQLGPCAIVYPGQQQHARAAIQWLSGSICQEHVFVHLGWRQLGTDWVYLHAGGGTGAQGIRRDVPVQVNGAMEHYQITSPADSDARRTALRASLGLLAVAPARITLPLLAGVYRAALGKVDFSVFVSGPSGSFKTALAAVCQQHFGAAMDARCLPGSFTATGNALEELAFAAKDALLVVDDFVPEADGRLQGVAERLFRAAGNHQGRARMDGQGRLQSVHAPRGLILATGEEVPRGQSLRARLLIVEVSGAGVSREKLSEIQRAGDQGWLSAAMGAFVQWVAGRYEAVQAQHRNRTMELRNQGYGGRAHHRLPSALAELQSAWEIWLECSHEAGAIGTGERQELWERARAALGELAVRQAGYQQASDPGWRFLRLLQAAVARGQAHVADRYGKVPPQPQRWGWRRKQASEGWKAQGSRIGWMWNNAVFLDPAVSYQVAQQAAGNQPLTISEQSLRHRLHARGLLASTDLGRQMLLVRRTVEGVPRQLLHLRASHFAGQE